MNPYTHIAVAFAFIFIFSQSTLALASDITRSTPSQAVACSNITVALDVSVSGNDTLYAIDDSVPSGWVINSATGEGDYSSSPGHVLWLYSNASTTSFQYDVFVPCNSNGTYVFAGTYSFDDLVEHPIGGQNSVSVSPSAVCTDNDKDGYAAENESCGPTDCNDNNPSINPAASDANNNKIDDNCDIEADEGYIYTSSAENPVVPSSGGSSSSGIASSGIASSGGSKPSGHSSESEDTIRNSTSTCGKVEYDNGRDDDCDGYIDEGNVNGSSNYDYNFNCTMSDNGCPNQGNVTTIISKDNKSEVELEWDTNKYKMNLSSIQIETGQYSDRGSIIIRGVDGYMTDGTTKTAYVKNIANYGSVCIKDSIVFNILDISYDCSGSDEMFVRCDGVEFNGYTCVADGYYKVTGLRHSAIVEQKMRLPNREAPLTPVLSDLGMIALIVAIVAVAYLVFIRTRKKTAR